MGKPPHTLPLLQSEGSSHGRLFSKNFSNTSPSHGLPLFLNCPRVGLFPRGAVLQEQAAPVWVPHGVISPPSKPALVWAVLFIGPQVLAGACSSMGSPQGHSFLQASTCSGMGSIPWAAGEYLLHCGPLRTAGGHLPHHGLHHELQGKALCSDILGTSSPLFFTDLGVCRIVSLTSSQSSLYTAVSPAVF